MAGSKPTVTPEGFVSRSIAAKILGISPDTLAGWRRRGQISIAGRTKQGHALYDPEVIIIEGEIIKRINKAREMRYLSWAKPLPKKKRY